MYAFRKRMEAVRRVGDKGGGREKKRQRKERRKGRFFKKGPPNCSRAKTYLYALL